MLRELLDQLLELQGRLAGILYLQESDAPFEEGVWHLMALGVALDDLLELLQGGTELPEVVVTLSEPVLRVGRQPVGRVSLQKLAEVEDGFFAPLLPGGAIRPVVGLLRRESHGLLPAGRRPPLLFRGGLLRLGGGRRLGSGGGGRRRGQLRGEEFPPQPIQLIFQLVLLILELPDHVGQGLELLSELRHLDFEAGALLLGGHDLSAEVDLLFRRETGGSALSGPLRGSGAGAHAEQKEKTPNGLPHAKFPQVRE